MDILIWQLFEDGGRVLMNKVLKRVQGVAESN